MYTAIILAAGRSKRLGVLTAQTPKCLLPLGAGTTLGLQTSILRAHGIADITVVTGFCEAQIRAALGSTCSYINNAEYDTTNSLYSLWLALRRVTGAVVILNSDVVFHPGLLADLLASAYPDALSVCFGGSLGSEEMKVKVKNDRIYDIRKDMFPAEADGENVGVVKFSAAGRDVLYAKVTELVAAGIVNAWAPLAFQQICSYHPLYAVATAGHPWIEIDFPDDLERARAVVYPQIEPGVACAAGM